MAEVKNIDRVNTGMNEKGSVNGFPSHLVDPSVKQQPEWCLRFLMGMHTGNNEKNIFRNNSQNYKQWRDYARGKQDIDQYKERRAAGKKRTKGKSNSTWKNLDYSIMPIAPKFVRVLEGMIMKQPRIVKTKGIDNESLEAERVYESKLSEWMFNKKWLVDVQQAMPSIQVNSPIAEGDPEPMTMGEIGLYKDIYYKDQNALELKDLIDTTMEVNKMDEEGRRECVMDLIEVGVAGTKSFVDTNGFLKSRHVVVERVRTNACKKNDHSDISWAGEYREITISELKQAAGNQFNEDQYKRIAEQSGNKTFANNTLPIYQEETNVSYPYDNEKITIFDGEWFSNDSRTSKISKNSAGNPEIERVPSNFLPKGVSDDMYKEKHNGEKYLMRRNLKNVYRGIWIVDTDFIYNYGLQTDMIRMGSALEDCKLSYSFYTTKFDSVIRKIIPILDQIQVNWLQFQNHNARSRPSGLSIEMSALENLSLGKGGEKMSPKEAIRLYFDTGILVWRRKEWGGSSNQWKPIDELANNSADGAQQSLSNIIQLIDMLRNILGINEVSDASTPNPDIGKFVTESAMVATQSAVNYLYYADQKIYEETAEKIALLMPSLIKRGKSKAFIGALGERSHRFFEKNIDLTRYEFSTKIEAGYSDEQRAVVQKYMEIDIANGMLSSEDGINIENEENPHKQAAMLRKAKLDKQKLDQEIAAQNAELEKQKNIESAQGAKAAEVEAEQVLSEMRMTEAKHASDLKKDEYNNQIKGQIVIAKIEAGIKLTEQEEELAASLLETNIKADTTIKVAEIGAKASKAAAAAKPKPTPAKKSA